ncbi:hypothetical protein [Paramaledivibacter caminithermalis]|uniref:Uncharacterized protein n=1 Tax=Paramaledivibacter caminithermalis (strain DSM 15212 / CIP 107654 / DViRD3) TaxID=1121301 RepID=A0A1M6QKL8_PARC5|nr:hypothetical protein [Paramaledivibacter caminithermalis]SHK20791.1 hypothetical protein SAMN02745912_02623 [Paramaledivibacter caminithermalis DSM 15212]
MFNIIATFNNIINLKKLMKKLRKNPKVKGHIFIINENDKIMKSDRYISNIHIKRSKEISPLGLDNTLKGIISGAIIGCLSLFFIILFNVNILGLSSLAIIGILAIIFYGAAVGSIIGLLVNNLLSRYYERNFDGEMTLILKELDDEVKNDVIDIVKSHTPEKLTIY